MRFDDRPANGKTHSHAVGLGREESVEDFIGKARINSTPRILHRNPYLPCIVKLRRDGQLSCPTKLGTHCVDGIRYQVHKNLLQLHPLDQYVREPVGHLGTQ